MQTKKRAKAVKFGSKTKPGTPEKEAELKKIEEEAEEIKKRVQQLEDESAGEETADDSPDETTPDVVSEAPHKVEAHFTSVQTVDIKEIPEEDEPEADEERKEDEANEVPPVAEEPQEPEKEDVGPPENAEEVPVEEPEEATIESAPAAVGQDGEFFNAPPDAYEKGSAFPYFLKVALVTFLLGVVLIAGGYYASQNENLRAMLPIGREPEPTEAPVTPEPTEVTVDLSKYTIRVLNGTGRSGEAATVQSSLETAGFNVVSVGNASGTDFEVTEISAVEEVEVEFLDKLKEELGKSYEVGEVERIASGAADIVVTLGGEKKQ